MVKADESSDEVPQVDQKQRKPPPAMIAPTVGLLEYKEDQLWIQ